VPLLIGQEDQTSADDMQMIARQWDDAIAKLGIEPCFRQQRIFTLAASMWWGGLRN